MLRMEENGFMQPRMYVQYRPWMDFFGMSLYLSGANHFYFIGYYHINSSLGRGGVTR